MTTLADIRRDYASRALTEQDAAPDPIDQFRAWFSDALRAEMLDVNAMTLATVSPSGDPSARTVLLKDVDERGFVFFTNYDSAKGQDLAAKPRACLLMFWAELERQVRVTGSVTKTAREESETYFQSRPFESRIGAWASPQSRVVSGREELDARYAEYLAKYPSTVPLPPFWGGYRVAPERIEFWQGRKSRLHDRLLYVKSADGTWTRERLAP